MAETPSLLGGGEEKPQSPVVTIIASLLVFFVFAGLVGLTYYYGSGLDAKPTTLSGEEQLKELRASEQALITNYGYEEQSKTWHVPITTAMDVLVRKGETEGKWDGIPKPPLPPKK